ncbi:hypothetical protein [Lapidilactobacillus luobeiensis]|uniref:hypothetical protein n=1 Tax=Lapidilactobacillus luobeiensis TaxID=2950371 RepID=UPI0021C40FE0|nr:hypothetical protein [Lapidilactobacillus luobeiensis]
MKSEKIIAVEYALTTFTKLCDTAPLKIVWNTSLGLAEFNAVHYRGEYTIILREEADNYELDEISATTTPNGNNLFSVVRSAVYKSFKPEFGPVAIFLLNRPDILLSKVTEIINSIDFSKFEMPNYDALLDFKLLDSNKKFDFVNYAAIDVIGPLTLISKS